MPENDSITEEPKRKTIQELFEGFEGECQNTEMDWGKPMGKELW